MRKVLLILIIVILLAFGITTAVNGRQIGNFRIYSIKDIEQKSEQLDSKVQEINTLIDSTYPSKTDALTAASKKMRSAKDEYLDVINFTTNEELESTLKIKNFDIERIWAKVGNHAIDQGVNITLSISEKSTTGARNLHFEVKGTYVAQTNFLYAIENDEELNYRIYNYKLVPYDGYVLKATFAIKEQVITKSLNDDLNGLEYVDPVVKDRVFTQEDKTNGRVSSDTAREEISSSPQSVVDQNVVSEGSGSSTSTATTTTPTTTDGE